MAKKRKKDTAHRVPPLSGVDTAIYLGGIAMICGVGVGYVALVSWLSKYAALRDSAVLQEDGSLIDVYFWSIWKSIREPSPDCHRPLIANQRTVP